MIIIFKIAELREAAGLTQKALADILGIKNNRLSQYETGARAVPAALLPGIAKALKCSIEDLYKQD